MILLHYRVTPGLDVGPQHSEPETSTAVTSTAEQHDCDCEQPAADRATTVVAA
jgi:hypothetical protein